MNSDQSQKDSKKPIALIIMLVLALILVIVAIVSLKKCAAAASAEGNEDGGDQGSDRTLGASAPIEQLLDPVPDGAGPFATRIGGEGPVYFILTDPENGKQTLNDDAGAVIYEFSGADRKAWLAGFSDQRVLIFYSDLDKKLNHPKETWDVRQHFSIAPGSTQFGIGPIFHNEDTIAKVLKGIK